MMELALRKGDNDRIWLARLDQCIAKDSNRISSLDGSKEYDERSLHLPVLWKKYHDHLAKDGAFWISEIRIATRERLEVA
jgi:hypothetical protein